MSDKWQCIRRMRDNQIFTAHEISASLVTAMDYVKHNFDQRSHANEFKAVTRCNTARMKANQFVANAYICQLSAENPGINVSLRTQQATAEIVERLVKEVGGVVGPTVGDVLEERGRIRT